MGVGILVGAGVGAGVGGVGAGVGRLHSPPSRQPSPSWQQPPAPRHLRYCAYDRGHQAGCTSRASGVDAGVGTGSCVRGGNGAGAVVVRARRPRFCRQEEAPMMLHCPCGHSAQAPRAPATGANWPSGQAKQGFMYRAVLL